MSDVIRDLLDNCKKERDALRAELAAERERNAAPSEYDLALLAERDALRALLREAREVIDGTHIEQYVEPFAARIDAALNKGGGDE